VFIFVLGVMLDFGGVWCVLIMTGLAGQCARGERERKDKEKET